MILKSNVLQILQNLQKYIHDELYCYGSYSI